MPGSLGTPRYEELINRLIDARNSAKLTQDQVARKLRKPQSFVAKYEGGERRLDVIEFMDVCQALGVRYDQILDGL
ncbi:MAG: helix-turn-helix domain-containing protein [Hyphomicrobiaceae bacterium]|nr:helix-turn-helix domain-containing protein [Hyphomicrobiaceae bacterium]